MSGWYKGNLAFLTFNEGTEYQRTTNLGLKILHGVGASPNPGIFRIVLKARFGRKKEEAILQQPPLAFRPGSLSRDAVATQTPREFDGQSGGEAERIAQIQFAVDSKLSYERRLPTLLGV